MAKIHVDIRSFRSGFPNDMAPPPLLIEFGEWLKKVPHASLGYFDSFASEPLDDTYVSDDDATEALRTKLGIFLHLPDGSRLALWKHSNSVPAVVLLGDGELENVASDLGTFLVALAKGKTGISDLDDDEASSHRKPLAEWLVEKRVRAKSGKIPSFEKWFEATVKGAVRPVKKGRPIVAGPVPDDLIARVVALVGRLADDPAVIELARELGFDLPSLRSADELRHLAQPQAGFALEFAWPWAYANKALEKAYPEAKRKAVKARMLWGIEVYAAGYKYWSRARGDYLHYDGFKGALPNGLSFKDKPAVAKKKFKDRRYEGDTAFTSYDSTTDIKYLISFAGETEGQIKKGSIDYVGVGRRRGFEP